MISRSLSHDHKVNICSPVYGWKYHESMNQNEFFFFKQIYNKFCYNDIRIIINVSIIPLQPLTLQFTSKHTTSLSYSIKCQSRPWNNMHLQIQSRSQISWVYGKCIIQETWFNSLKLLIQTKKSQKESKQEMGSVPNVKFEECTKKESR